MGRKVDSVRVQTVVSPEAYGFLETIASLGIHGKTPAEVVSKFISTELERLIVKERILDLAAAQQAQRSTAPRAPAKRRRASGAKKVE